MKIYKKCTAKPCSFLVNYTNLPSENSLRFRQNLLKEYETIYQNKVAIFRWLSNQWCWLDNQRNIVTLFQKIILVNNETSRYFIYFKIICPSKHF